MSVPGEEKDLHGHQQGRRVHDRYAGREPPEIRHGEGRCPGARGIPEEKSFYLEDDLQDHLRPEKRNPHGARHEIQNDDRQVTPDAGQKEHRTSRRHDQGRTVQPLRRGDQHEKYPISPSLLEMLGRRPGVHRSRDHRQRYRHVRNRPRYVHINIFFSVC